MSLSLTYHATAPVPATATATINAEGPRSGPSGTAFLNAEGTGTGKYASFGILDFGKISAGKAKKLKLSLAQSNARFSKDGPIKFAICDGSLAASALKFSSKGMQYGAEALHPVRLGEGDFKIAKGQKQDAFVFPLTPAVSKILASSKNVRIVVLPASATVAATYAGAGHKSLPHPTIELLR